MNVCFATQLLRIGKSRDETKSVENCAQKVTSASKSIATNGKPTTIGCMQRKKRSFATIVRFFNITGLYIYIH